MWPRSSSCLHSRGSDCVGSGCVGSGCARRVAFPGCSGLSCSFCSPCTLRKCPCTSNFLAAHTCSLLFTCHSVSTHTGASSRAPGHWLTCSRRWAQPQGRGQGRGWAMAAAAPAVQPWTELLPLRGTWAPPLARSLCWWGPPHTAFLRGWAQEGAGLARLAAAAARAASLAWAGTRTQGPAGWPQHHQRPPHPAACWAWPWVLLAPGSSRGRWPERKQWAACSPAVAAAQGWE